MIDGVAFCRRWYEYYRDLALAVVTSEDDRDRALHSMRWWKKELDREEYAVRQEGGGK